jgi:hypothetical protein
MAIFLGKVLLAHCECSGAAPVGHAVRARAASRSDEKIPMTFRGAAETIYVKRGQVAD